MNKSSRRSFEDRVAEGWNRFWFTPADPTVLGLIRICCGLVTLYTVAAYSFDLQPFFGEHGWWNLEEARRIVHEKPYSIDLLRGRQILPPPASEFEKEYIKEFQAAHGGIHPYPPYPANPSEMEFAEEFLKKYGFDFRVYKLPFPKTDAQRAYLFEYVKKWKQPPAPPYPTDEAEAIRIDEYFGRWGCDPRIQYTVGKAVWSVYFHVTDPTAMAWIHWGIVLATFLFMIGFCTRITSVLTWMGQLCYIHRNTFVLFGVDTMMMIVLFYLMIGPSGAAWSVDRRIARWWSQSKPRIIARWRSFWGLPPAEIKPAAPFSPNPLPSVSANFAIRLLQIHVCIIYLAAGLSKMQGNAWWNGTAVWGTLANYEFAPMQFGIYNDVLSVLGQNKLVFALFLTTASYFTLFFEIGYAFLIWRPATRWVILGMAVTLHAFIGLFMGLKTFSLMMLVMNMAFLRPEEARLLVGRPLEWCAWAVGLVFGRGHKAVVPPTQRKQPSAV